MGKKHKKRKSKRYSDTEDKDEEVVREERVLPKLVLKVHKEDKPHDESAGSSDEYRREIHKDKHKKKKKKDKKHKHKHDESKKSRKREHPGKEDDIVPPVKKIHIKVSDLPREEQSVQDVQSAPQTDSNGEKRLPALQLCLENLHRTLQRKDTHGIFTYPVTDAIAPNYSKVVTNPMDFSTMLYKIGHKEYPSIESFKDDFILMCKNAMLYNAPDTIYYKAAEKLLSAGMKTLSEDKIRKMKKSIGIVDDSAYAHSMAGVFDETIDVDTLEDDEFGMKTGYGVASGSQPIDHQSITDQVLGAAKDASERLKQKYKNSKIGFLRKDSEGNTSLAILNPDTAEGPHSVPVNLGKMSGKLISGSSTLSSTKEDKKNKVIPVSYLAYGPYGSFGPTYDSSLSNITVEESALLLETYGSDTGVHYAKSLQNFVKDANSFAQNLVDKFLDAMTDGSHSKWIRRQEQKELQKSQKLLVTQNIGKKISSESDQSNSAEATAVSENKENDASKIDFKSLMTLTGDGIDVSFLKDLVPQVNKDKTLTERDELQIKLDENAKFLKNLKNAQDERLLKKPQESKAPSEQEILMAENLTGNIKELLARVRPGDVASQESVRKALGIGTVSDNPSEQEKEKRPELPAETQSNIVTEIGSKDPSLS